MKYLLFVPDGAADEPLAELNGKTPLETARTPYLDGLARQGLVGAVQVTPESMYPGSDAANMALLGYDPARLYTGRGPIEAAAIDVPMDAKDVAFRCSLISTDGETLVDYSAGHIPTQEASPLIEMANRKLCGRAFSLFPGVSYRHVLRWHGGSADVRTYAPHENMGRALVEIMPEGDGDVKLRRFIEDSLNLLDSLPYNRRRRADGKPPANMLWPWSPGRTPNIVAFTRLRGVSGAVIAAVDVVRGLGKLAGLEVIDVPGATGYLDTNYAGKGRAAATALKRHDFVFVHVEAPDEAGHAGDIDAKIKAIESFDRLVVGTALDRIDKDQRFRLLCAPDHKTPVSTRGHALGPVPFLLFDSQTVSVERGHRMNVLPFDERAVEDATVRVKDGFRLIDLLFELEEP